MKKDSLLLNGAKLLTFTMLFPVINTAYPLHCPHTAQWELRSKAFCNSTIPAYRCLFDESLRETVERCEKFHDYQTPGFKFILRGGYDGEPCSENRFQPFKFWTNSSRECVFFKSNCEGEGQVVVNVGSKTKDNTCTCDYTRGYAFVTTPRSKYYCFPFTEDCSCYIKDCGEDGRLSSEFTCKPKETVIGRTTGGVRGKIGRVCPLDDTTTNIYSKLFAVSSRSLCAILVLQLIFLIIVISGVLCWSKET